MWVKETAHIFSAAHHSFILALHACVRSPWMFDVVQHSQVLHNNTIHKLFVEHNYLELHVVLIFIIMIIIVFDFVNPVTCSLSNQF